ncbi:MAG: hypothetical protein AB1454_00315 [Candidatus Auribacterota bacterium]
MHEKQLSKNVELLRATLRRGQVVPGEVYLRLTEREVLIKVKGKIIKAYTNLAFSQGDSVYLFIEQVHPQLRFKLLSKDDYNRILTSGIDYTI